MIKTFLSGVALPDHNAPDFARRGSSLLLGILISCASLLSSPAATLTVTNTADSGDGTLRQAILDANADASPDLVTIGFDMPGSGVQTIAPLSGLPTITRPVTIDGYTQPGASPNTLANSDDATLLIELSGASLGSPAYGLRIAAGGSTVRGLVSNTFTNGLAGIRLEDCTNSVIEGNFIGTDATGTNGLPNDDGIYIQGSSSGTRVGGSSPSSRNVIGANAVGINVEGNSHQILGNFVGLGADGMTALQNGKGVLLGHCSQIQVGGAPAGAGNGLS